MSDLARLQQKLDSQKAARAKEMREACRGLLKSPEGQRWFELARAYFEVDRPRFRRDDPNHDDALLRDGAAEVFYFTVQQAGDLDETPEF